ncbi:MAG: hypothetical protein V2A79_04625 [Planctomycetota bacterium]
MRQVNRHPSTAEIRTFGWVILAGLLVIGALLWCADGYKFRPDQALWHWTGSTLQGLAVILWVVGPLAGLVSLSSPRAGLVIYVVWMTGATYIGVVMTFVLLTVLYFVLLPVFSLIRLKDPLRLKLRGPGESYWEDHEHHESTLERTIRPF